MIHKTADDLSTVRPSYVLPHEKVRYTQAPLKDSHSSAGPLDNKKGVCLHFEVYKMESKQSVVWLPPCHYFPSHTHTHVHTLGGIK